MFSGVITSINQFPELIPIVARTGNVVDVLAPANPIPDENHVTPSLVAFAAELGTPLIPPISFKICLRSSSSPAAIEL